MVSVWNRLQGREELYCAICDRWLNGPAQWEYHLQEDKHKRRQRRLRRQKAREGRQMTDGGEEVEEVGPQHNAQEVLGKTVADFAQPNPEDLGGTDDFDDTGGWAPDSIEMKNRKQDREEENRNRMSTQTALVCWAGGQTTSTDKNKPPEEHPVKHKNATDKEKEGKIRRTEEGGTWK